MKKYVFESLKFFCAAILCTILSAFTTPSWGANCNLIDESQILNTNGFSINENGYYNGSFYNWANVRFSFDNAFKENTQYTLSFNGYVSSNTAVFSFGYTDGTGGRCDIRATQAKDYTCTTEPNKTLSNISTTYGSGANTVYVKNIQLEEGTTATAYTPYNPLCATCDGTIVNYTSATGTVVQDGTPTPTNPIEPVFYQQGNMVLRKVGDIADSYDATTGKITRRVGVAVLDGTERWGSHTSNTGWFQLAGDIFPTDVNASALSTHYMQYTHNPSGMANQDILFGRPDSSTGRVVIRDAINFPDVGLVGDFKSWLAQQYAAGTPVTVWYPLAEPVEEDWPASYCETPIKIATTKYNETKFSPLNTALANAISVVDTVVSNTITQAASIATLQAQKQTRPNDIADDNEKCPAGKKCLLVEDASGTPHWYEIVENAYGLPSGYTALEYIQSDGASYLIVPYRVNNKTVFYCRYNEIQNGPQTANAVFGVTTSPDVSKANNGILRLTGSNYNRMGWGNSVEGSVMSVNAPKEFNTWYEVLYDQNKLYQNDRLYATSTTQTNVSWVAEYDLGVFARNSANVTMPAIAKISSVWAKENGEYKINLIPVKRNSDNVVGMFDTVSGEFFTNKGSGSFIAGDPVVE